MVFCILFHEILSVGSQKRIAMSFSTSKIQYCPILFASSPALSVSLTILMSTSSNEQFSNWTEKVLERRKTTANFMCFFLEGHTDCGDLNHLLRDANINERGRLADILILDRSLLTTCCIILSHVSLEISDVGRLFYNDLIIFELSA